LASRVAERFSFGKIPEVLPLPDLIAVQHESFQWFLDEGLREIFNEISPIEDFTGSLALELTNHRFNDPVMSLEDAKERDSNYARPLFVTARFMNRGTGEIKEQQVFLGDFPIMTDKGVFIINGTERVIVSQLVRSPGIYFDTSKDKTSDKMIYSGKVIPGRGAWLEFDTDKKDTIGVRVDRKRRQYVSAFLKALGIAETDEEILEMFGNSESIRNTIEKDTAADKDEALLDLYRKLRPGEPTTVESARGLIQTLFRNPKRYDLTRVGRYKMSQKFNEKAPKDYRAEGLQLLRDEDIIDAIRWHKAQGYGGEEFLFSKDGSFPKYLDSYVRSLKNVQKKLGLRLLSHKALGRHSVASQAATSGESIKAIQAQLGHKSEQSTHRYAHLGSRAQLQLVESLTPISPSHVNLVSTGKTEGS